MLTAYTLESNKVCTIGYICRDIGCGIEADVIRGYWTGEVDVWGKFTIQPVDGSPCLYLFADEIVEVEDL